MELLEITKLLKNDPDLSGWEVTRTNTRALEAYLIFEETESIREVISEEYQVNLYLLQEREGNPVLGESSFWVSQREDLRPFLGQAKEMARLVANPVFELVAPGREYREVQTVDQTILRDPDQILAKIVKDLSAGRPKEVSLSSSEVFVIYREIHLTNSRGLSARRRETEIYVDFVLLAGDPGNRETESHAICRTRFYRDLNIGAHLQKEARYARDTLTAVLPENGNFPVVFGDEALDTFFSYFAAQASGAARYQGWSRFKEGELISGEARGDPLTLYSNPLIPGGMKTRSFDEHGWPLAREEVIRANRFLTPMADNRYAGYLGIPPRGNFANLELAPGTASLEELLGGEGPVYYLLKFSTFQPNPVTGAFSGEIRVGYLLKGGQKITLKGGSVAGTMDQALHTIRFSKETVRREAYLGPSAFRIEDLALAGNG
jgi:PmbA protein